jgi:hypothetical protein
MKLEGAEAVNQLQELANIIKLPIQPSVTTKTLAKRY